MVRLQTAALLSRIPSLSRRALVAGDIGPIFLLGLACAFLFFYGLSSSELWRTESLRAVVAQEMLENGDWVVPTLYGEPLLTKPPGMYAAIALASWPFGEVSHWSARLPSAIAATTTVFLFYWTFRRYFGPRGGLVAALILPTSLMWLERVPSAEIDLLQLAWVTAALVFFLRAVDPIADCGLRIADSNAAIEQSAIRNPQSAMVYWFAALLCVAGGFLTKWTAPAFFYGTVIPLLWWRGRLRLLLSWPHLLGVGLALGLILAWVGAAAARVGWDVLYETVWREAAQHIVPGHRDDPYPWAETLAFPFVIVAANLPWSVFALATLRPRFAQLWDERGRLLWQFLHCWTWPSLIFWSAIPGHSARHSFPLSPGLAGLAALAWIIEDRRQKAEGRKEGRYRFGPPIVFVGLLVVWLLVKVVFMEVVVPARMRDRQPREKGEQIARQVPRDETLYVFRLKDEGIMFYCGRPVRRLPGPKQLPSSKNPLYVVLTEEERQSWHFQRPVEEVLRLTDQQGQPIVLLRVWHEPFPARSTGLGKQSI